MMMFIAPQPPPPRVDVPTRDETDDIKAALDDDVYCPPTTARRVDGPTRDETDDIKAALDDDVFCPPITAISCRRVHA
jgi:hypothetical protein